MKGESDASGCAACQRLSDPVRGSEGVDGTGGNGVVNSGSVSGIDVEGEEEEDDDEDDEVSPWAWSVGNAIPRFLALYL